MLQAAPPPHRQDPSTAHVSAFIGSHGTQGDPPDPQVAGACGWQAWATSQHPVAQLELLQAPPVHWPPEHVCWGPQAGNAPQRHCPWAEQLSALPAGQGWHAAPGGAQKPTLASAVQTLPAQHPEGHEARSHTQAPPTQRCPGPHRAPPGPQLQAPELRQRSASWGLHAVHAAPFGPQVVADRAAQVVPLQQPVGHESAVHSQPARPQVCPGAHAGSVPHRHAPVAEHAFARVGSQAAHAVPGAPHCVATVAITHLSPSQQPLGHEVASHLHWFSTQRWPAEHATAAPPSAPTAPH